MINKNTFTLNLVLDFLGPYKLQTKRSSGLRTIALCHTHYCLCQNNSCLLVEVIYSIQLLRKNKLIGLDLNLI
jgi:hypothetical protein